MLTRFWQKVKSDKGFTLVELLVVVAIIGILIGIAVPVFNNITESAERRTVEANLRLLEGALMMYYAETGSYTTNITDLLGTYVEANSSDDLGPGGIDYGLTVDASSGRYRAYASGKIGSKSLGATDFIPIDWD